jgi:trans-2,3-dihydro-3-hydroxyanthranilate isomerase
VANYLVYDVFTDKAFGGNQLAVFPDASNIPEDMLQSVAAEFNFSEVTFVYPPEDPKHTARVRIFTPTSEIDFAGHPTIGTAVALFGLGHAPSMVLELGVGPMPCSVDSTYASFTTSVPLQKISEPEPALVAAALSLTLDAICTETHVPVQASMGLPFILVELDSRASLAACMPNIEAIRKGAERYPAGLDFAVFAYARKGDQISSRMFAPLDNIQEDPATGSASATLAVLLTEINGAPQSLIFSQGEDMGRPSRIEAVTEMSISSPTGQNPVRVTISGQAVQTMAGKFIL